MALKPTVSFASWDATSGSIDTLMPILTESHGGKLTRDQASQKFCSVGRSAVAVIAKHDGMPRGIVAFGPVPFASSRLEVKSGVIHDVYVSPELRGQGVFQELLARGESLCRDEGWEVMLSFPNSSSRPGFERAGWSSLAMGRAWVGPARALRVGSESPSVNSTGARETGFVPQMQPPLSKREIMQLHGLERPDAYLVSNPGLDDLSHRLSHYRGSSYRVVEGDGAAALLRVGTRGKSLEVQIMSTAPRRPSTTEFASIVALVRQQFRPSLLTCINLGAIQRRSLARSFMAPYRTVTQGFGKKIGSATGVDLRDFVFTGIDIHTW